MLSTPKKEISWKELSVLLKSVEKKTSQSKSVSNYVAGSQAAPMLSGDNVLGKQGEQRCSTPNRNRAMERKKLISAAKAEVVFSPSVASSRRRSVSRSPSLLLSSARVARLGQSRAARKLLDSISPHLFMKQETNENQDPHKYMATSSPAQTRTPRHRESSSSWHHKTPPRPPTSTRKPTLSAKLSSSLNAMTPPRHPSSARKLLQSLSLE